jgi:hypothetical protein
MNSLGSLRKPKLHFDTAANPSHVTFDDGKNHRRNIPWLHYVETRWDYSEPDTVRVSIGQWIVALRGHNLGPLFISIEEKTLARIRARPDLSLDSIYELDTFVTEVTFGKARPELGK